jgi:hypothetical protein
VASAAALAAPSLASAAVIGSLLTSREAEAVLTPLTGSWARIDGSSAGVEGILAGLTTALMIVVAGSWWGRPAVPAPASAAVPPQPTEVPAPALVS